MTAGICERSGYSILAIERNGEILIECPAHFELCANDVLYVCRTDKHGLGAQRQRHRRDLRRVRESKERAWGVLNGRWVPHDLRDEVVDFVVGWSQKTELPIKIFLVWPALSPAKFYDWKQRYGKANEHNGQIPRDFWLKERERQAIPDFHERNPLEGYRRATLMMLDQDVVAVCPSSVYWVLSAAGRLDRWTKKPSKKGQGFGQPKAAH